MFKITINDKEYGFPQRLTVAQWKEISRYDVSQRQNWAKIISIVFGVSPRELKEASEFTLELGIGILIGVLNKRTECKHFDFTKLQFGQWVDLDIWSTSGVAKNIDNMLTILGETEWADEALYKVEAFNAYRSYIYRQYAELFGLNVEGDEIIVDEKAKEVTGESVAEGWWSIIIGLSSDNLLNVDKITDMPLLITLNFMAHQKQKQIRENFNKLKQQKEYELQRRRK